MKKIIVISLVMLLSTGVAYSFPKEQDKREEDTYKKLNNFAVESIELIEERIDGNTRGLENKKLQHMNEADNIIEEGSKKISNRRARMNFIAEQQKEVIRLKNRLRATYDKKIKNGAQEIIDVAENNWRTVYIQCTPGDKGRVLFLYESILDQLAADGYITTGEAIERKGRICREWPEARTAYGQE
ncbi:MAG: hypothetical protein U9R44_07435 [Candidatus Omnitrophota bacterium]|nr:hypothetical protein [Candidatus Omnitrophota bacterium]